MIRFCFLLIVVFLNTSVYAQRAFRAGLLFGLNASQVHGDTYSGFNKAGGVGGIFVSTNPEKKWYGQMEMQYSMKGSRKIANPEKGDYDFFELRMNYIEVPLLLRLNLKRIVPEIGLAFAVLVNTREFDDFGEITPIGYRRTETSTIVGVSYQINSHWMFNLRSTNSFFPVKVFPTPIYYQRFIPNLFNRGMYHNVVGLTISYRLGGSEQ